LKLWSIIGQIFASDRGCFTLTPPAAWINLMRISR